MPSTPGGHEIVRTDMVKVRARRGRITYTLHETQDPLSLLKKVGADQHTYRWAYELEVFQYSTNVMIAKAGFEVVGIFGVDTRRAPPHTEGTYVVRKWRRRGIASTMWEITIKRLKLAELISGTITKIGSSFVRSVLRNESRGYELIHNPMES